MWAKLRQQLWQWRGVLIAAPSVAGLLIGLRSAGLLQAVELAALDEFFRRRPKEAVDSRIVIVEINEAIEVVLSSDRLAPQKHLLLAAKLPRLLQIDLIGNVVMEGRQGGQWYVAFN